MILKSHPVLSCAEAKQGEANLLKDEAAEWTAMQQAGAAIARSLLNDFKEIGGLPDNARLLVLAGKGHNGGDALLAAKEILAQYPHTTADIVLCFGEAALRPLARCSLDALREMFGGDAAPSPRSAATSAPRAARLQFLDAKNLSESTTYDLCLDGIFGFQFHPPLTAATAELIAQVNIHPQIKFRAAVDLPSGLGENNAATVFRADFTYATGMVKSPVIAEANAAHIGRLRYLDLGFFEVGGALVAPRCAASAPPTCHPGDAFDRILLPSILRPLAQLRPAQTDKRTYGHLFVLGGSRHYPGAVLMTVQAALRSGVGLLTAFVPESLVPEYAARFPEAMWVGLPQTSTGGISSSGVPWFLEKLPRATALVIGPGLGAEAETLAAVQTIVRQTDNSPLLLDADALRPEVLEAARSKPFIGTPHAGEFKRIASDVPLRDFCRQRCAVVVQKGPLTRISDGEAVYHSPFGGPVLARGGSGDLLAGLIGGLLAQKPDDLLLAAARGVVWHGLAADLLARDRGQVAVQTTQLLDYLPQALREAL